MPKGYQRKLFERPVLLQDWFSTQQEDRRVTWTELFYDLIHVAAAIQMSVGIIDNEIDVIHFAIIFSVFWWHWYTLSSFFTRFTADDLLQKTIFCIHMAGMVGMSMSIRHVQRNISVFLFSLAIASLGGFGMNFVIYLYIPRARHSARSYCLSYLASILMAIVGTFTPLDVSWVLISGSVVSFAFVAWIQGKLKHRLPVHVEHTAERHGLFFILIIGETMVAIVIVEMEMDWQHFLSVFFGLVIAFALHLTYFDTQPFDAEKHAINRNRTSRRLFVYLHWVLTGTALAMGIAIKKLIKYIYAKYVDPSTAWMLCIGFGLSFGTLFFVRQTHHMGEDHTAKAPPADVLQAIVDEGFVKPEDISAKILVELRRQSVGALIGKNDHDYRSTNVSARNSLDRRRELEQRELTKGVGSYHHHSAEGQVKESVMEAVVNHDSGDNFVCSQPKLQSRPVRATSSSSSTSSGSFLEDAIEESVFGTATHTHYDEEGNVLSMQIVVTETHIRFHNIIRLLCILFDFVLPLIPITPLILILMLVIQCCVFLAMDSTVAVIEVIEEPIPENGDNSEQEDDDVEDTNKSVSDDEEEEEDEKEFELDESVVVNVEEPEEEPVIVVTDVILTPEDLQLEEKDKDE